LEILVNDGDCDIQQRAGEMSHLLLKSEIWETSIVVLDCPQEADVETPQMAALVNLNCNASDR
jgi:hypothetical protein